MIHVCVVVIHVLSGRDSCVRGCDSCASGCVSCVSGFCERISAYTISQCLLNMVLSIVFPFVFSTISSEL